MGKIKIAAPKTVEEFAHQIRKMQWFQAELAKHKELSSAQIAMEERQHMKRLEREEVQRAVKEYDQIVAAQELMENLK